MTVPPRSGYTLPVFACAAAIAALRCLQAHAAPPTVTVQLLDPPETAEIPIEAGAPLTAQTALAIARSDPGDNLDLTRHTPIWAMVSWGNVAQTDPLIITGGEGIGRLTDGQPAIYRYARRLLSENLIPLLQPGQRIHVTLILPEGRTLAQRTSNEAFGIVEGLSLLGTTGISQPLSAPGQLAEYRDELQQKARQFDCLVFCVGENGLALSQTLGINPAQIVKTANWLGPLLVEAGFQGVQSILLFGYHGKLLKLAGGIFHTHHHVADARLEILTAQAARAGLPLPHLQQLLACATAEDGLAYLSQLTANGPPWVETIYDAIAHTVDQRAQEYIYAHSATHVLVGSVLFNRRRQIIVSSKTGVILLKQTCSSS